RAACKPGSAGASPSQAGVRNWVTITMATERGKQPVGFAIIGCGMIAAFHARALAEVPGARVVALVSRQLDRAQKFRQHIGADCAIYDNLPGALARPDV